ncbi:MAG: hypothetical protein WA484_00810 [Solirubrobacteraceae bacterium]
MSAEYGREVPVTFTDGVHADVTSLVGSLTDEKASTALKRRIAELLVECKANPYVGELMGPGRHPELADCRGCASTSPRIRASRAFDSCIATSRPTARPPSACGSPLDRGPACVPTV